MWCLGGLGNCPVSLLESHRPKGKGLAGAHDGMHPEGHCIPHILFWPHRGNFPSLNKDVKSSDQQ